MSPGLSPKRLAGVSRWLAAALLALGLGCEASCLPNDELWVSLGWNVFGFTDRTRDLSAQDQTQRGVDLRLRFKFDEALF